MMDGTRFAMLEQVDICRKCWTSFITHRQPDGKLHILCPTEQALICEKMPLLLREMVNDYMRQTGGDWLLVIVDEMPEEYHLVMEALKDTSFF